MKYRLSTQEIAEAIVTWLQTKHRFLDGTTFSVDYEVFAGKGNDLVADVTAKGPGKMEGPYR